MDHILSLESGGVTCARPAGGRRRTQFQSVTVSQSPYMLETDGDTAVFQFSLEINYVQAV